MRTIANPAIKVTTIPTTRSVVACFMILSATKPINEVDFSPGHEDARDVLLCVIAV